jgi:2-polyprenyl-3-methyl-5-hydroxy-6-metoxy-1,4-benzoquinol methylase
MVISWLNCPLCHSVNIEHYLSTKDHMLTGEAFEIWNCDACGFIFTQNTPPAGEIGKYYQSSEYISHSDTRKGLMNRLYHIARNFMLGRKYHMVHKVAKGKRLLDIGCGTGYFPAYLKRKGYDVAGVEVDPKAREFAGKEFGLAVYTPDEFLHNKIHGKYDVITLWHVLEHLEDFNLYLEKMIDQLAPGGSMVIALPNCLAFDARHYKEYWAGYDVPRHLWHFTPSTLKILAGKHGLKVTGMKRLPLDPFYNAMLSGKYRKNKLFMISGIIIGKLAYLESLFNLKKSSSIVYFINHKNNPR